MTFKICKLVSILCLFLISISVNAQTTVYQGQYNRMYNHGKAVGVRVVPKTGCTNQEFYDELVLHKDDVGYVYTIDYKNESESYAFVNNYGQSVEVVYDEGAGPFPTHSYDGWGNAMIEYSNMVATYYIMAESMPGMEYVPLSNPYTTATNVGRFYIDLKNKIKATFNTRMSCVKYEAMQFAALPTMYPDNDNINAAIDMGAVNTKYPIYNTPAKISNIAVVDSPTTLANQYPEHLGRYIDAPVNNSVKITTNGVASYVLDNIINTFTTKHADIMSGIVLSIAPIQSKVLNVHTLNNDAKGCRVECTEGLDYLYNSGIDDNDIRVVNLSFTSELSNLPKDFQDKINQLVTDKDVVVVQSTGNIPVNVTALERKRLPTDLQLTVGTITDGKIRSTSGENLTDIVVNNPGGDLPIVGNIAGVFTEKSYSMTTFENLGQTSVAAAEVSGFVSWMRSVFPWLTATQVKEAICLSATPIPAYNSADAEVNAAENKRISWVKCGIFNPIAAMDYAYTNMRYYPATPLGYVTVREDSTPIIYFIDLTTNWSAYTEINGDAPENACQNWASFKNAGSLAMHNTYGTPYSDTIVNDVIVPEFNTTGWCELKTTNGTTGETTLTGKQLLKRSTYPHRFYASSLQELVDKANDMEYSWLVGKRHASIDSSSTEYSWKMLVTDTYPADGITPDMIYNLGPTSWTCPLGGTVLTINNIKMCNAPVTVE